ncbi:MAG TPA: hypothetical protein PLE32_00960, partial [Haliscomenobacter sp.]|nr:hypothetical protein [Haliscomenobacter sp.]
MRLTPFFGAEKAKNDVSYLFSQVYPGNITMNDSFLDGARGKYKSLQVADFPKKLSERLPQYKGRWQGSLAEQIKDLPAFEQVERE